jgi:light-harvesting complex 1 beta chain
MITQSVHHARTPRPDSIGFFGILVASFIVFLFVALVAQLLTLNWRNWLPGAEGETTLIEGVRASVYTFMSYLT